MELELYMLRCRSTTTVAVVFLSNGYPSYAFRSMVCAFLTVFPICQ